MSCLSHYILVTSSLTLYHIPKERKELFAGEKCENIDNTLRIKIEIIKSNHHFELS